MFRVPRSLRRRRWKVLVLGLLAGLVLAPVWVPQQVGDDLGILLPDGWADALGEWVDPAAVDGEPWTPFKDRTELEEETEAFIQRPRPTHFPGRRYAASPLERAERERRLRFEDEGLSIGLESGLRLHLNSQGARPDNLLDTGGIVPTPEEERLRRALEEQRIRIGVGGEF